MTAFDPVALAVIRGRLEQIVDEMDASLFRAAFSPVIAEARDGSHGIYDATTGATVAMGKTGLPVFIGAMSFATKAVIDRAALGLDLEPAAVKADSRSGENVGEREVKGVKLRVLVAEDNVVNQKIVLKLLSKLGHSADAVANGLEVVQANQRMAYDLILMDCQMPDMDGYQATAEIRKLESKDGHIPIIALTANAMAGDREKCLNAGMDDFLTKPIQPKLLSETLNKWAAAMRSELETA